MGYKESGLEAHMGIVFDFWATFLIKKGDIANCNHVLKEIKFLPNLLNLVFFRLKKHLAFFNNGTNRRTVCNSISL